MADRIGPYGVTLPADWKARNYRAIPTHDGVAFTVDLLFKGKPVGTIEDSGTGGGAWAHVYGEERKAWQQAVAQYSPAIRREYFTRWGIPVGEDVPDEEMLCGALVDEADRSTRRDEDMWPTKKGARV